MQGRTGENHLTLPNSHFYQGTIDVAGSKDISLIFYIIVECDAILQLYSEKINTQYSLYSIKLYITNIYSNIYILYIFSALYKIQSSYKYKIELYKIQKYF